MDEGSADGEYVLALAAAGAGALLDLERSLVNLQRAAERGHRTAQLELAGLVGNWRLAKDIGDGRAQRPETWGRLRAAVDIAAWLAVPRGQALSEAPRIAMVKRFLSAPVCDWVTRLAQPELKNAEIFDRESGALRYDGVRNNRAAALGPGNSDTLVGFVRARIAALAEVPVPALEGTQILHYGVGQRFGPHHDFLDVRYPGLAQEVAAKGQRALTLLVYLNDDYAGGETAFPALGRRFKGRKGDALVFWNLTEDGAPDWNTQHVGTAPTSGEKWLLSQWIRIRVEAELREPATGAS